MNTEPISDQDYLFLIFDRIKEYRIAQRLSQRDLSRISGASLSLIQRMEQHRQQNTTMLNMISILRALGMEDRLTELLPKLPIAPDIMKKITKATPKRIRTTKHQIQ